jgi:hypothetical protein
MNRDYSRGWWACVLAIGSACIALVLLTEAQTTSPLQICTAHPYSTHLKGLEC